MAVTDVALNETRPSQLSEESYRVCAVIPSTFTGLARCDITPTFGRYVFIKASRKMELKMCDIEVHRFRECHRGNWFTLSDLILTTQILPSRI